MAFAVNLKTAGLNIFRAASHIRQNAIRSPNKCLFQPSILLFFLSRHKNYAHRPGPLINLVTNTLEILFSQFV